MTSEYEPRYLAGIVCFNRRDFFEAHEVWENLWLDENVGTDRRFVQGLIQAAVGLFHFGNGNRRGAVKLYGTAKNYMAAYPSPYLGLDHGAFWYDMERCFADLHADPENPGVHLNEMLIPTIALDPPPVAWPDPESYLHDE